MSEISQRNISRLGERKEEVLSMFNKEKEQSERVLNPWKNRLVKYNELYKMVQSKKHYEGLANIFVPEVLRAVETITGNLFKIIFGQMPWFEYLGRNKGDEGAAKAHTELVRFQMDENGFKSRTMDSLRQMVVSGITVRKILWDFTQVNRTKKVKKGSQLEAQSGVETIKDHWTFEPVDLLGFHISDVSTPYNDIQKARWIAEEYKVDRHWLREKQKKGWLVKISAEELQDKVGERSQAENLRQNRRSSSGYSFDSNKDGIHVFERWGLVRADWVYTSEEIEQAGLESDDLVESVAVVVNNKIIAKLEANPFWHNQKPYVSCPYIAQEFDFAGIGAAQIAENLQEELNDTRNQTMDNKTLILMNMWKKNRSAGISNKDLKIRPNGVIQANDINGLEPLRPPVLTGVGVNIEAVVKEDLRQSVGASSNLQGIAQPGVSTATESTTLNREAFGRLFNTAELYSELVLKPTLIFAEFLNQQFYDTSKVIKIVGEAGIKYVRRSPEELVGYKDVSITLATDIDDNSSVKRQQLLQFLTIMQSMDPTMIEYHWRLLDRIYKSFFPNRLGLEDLYEAPASEESLLTAEEEMDLMLEGEPVEVKKGDNHEEHLQKHQEDLEAMQYALPSETLKLLQKHIMEHEAKVQEMLAMQEAQLMQAKLGQAQEQGGGMDRGRTQDTTPNTQRAATTPGQLMSNVKGR